MATGWFTHKRLRRKVSPFQAALDELFADAGPQGHAVGMVADRYTHGHHESVLRSHIWRSAENSAAYLLPHLQEGACLLDVGCGPGTITADLASCVAPGQVVAIDNSDDVIEAARTTLFDRGASNVTVEKADVYNLPYSDECFDVVHAHQVLQHLTDPVRALVEMRRVCRTGGIVAVREGDYPAMTWYPPSRGMDRWREIYLAVARGNGAEPEAGRRLLSWAQRAGFEDVVPSASVWCYATREDRSWWGGSWAQRLTESALADQAIEGGHATRSELEWSAQAWLRWAESPDGWYVVVHGEVLCRA